MSAAAASGASIASSGLKAYGDYESGVGKAAGATYRAQTLEANAQRARVSAVQTGAAESQQLATTLGNIDAVRAAAHGDPTSPMASAYRNQQEDIGQTKKAIDVDQIEAEAKQKESDANYLQYASGQALKQGKISAGVDIASALAKALV